jgi:hypothetical protein
METPEPDLIHATGCKHPSLRRCMSLTSVTLHYIVAPWYEGITGTTGWPSWS